MTAKKKDSKIYTINFSNLFFDCIVALDGDLPPKKIFKTIGKIPVFAADGAAISLFRKKIIADFVIGDLDTFFNSPLSSSFEKEKLICNPSQELNDFEKTLIFAEESGYKNILILGFHGGELEHTLNNWSILKKYSKKLNLCLLDRNRYGIPIYQSCTFNCLRNEMISLIPQPEVKISTKNLKWNLNNESLLLGAREGARNLATSDNVSIHIHYGELLLFINSRLPFAPDFNFD